MKRGAEKQLTKDGHDDDDDDDDGDIEEIQDPQGFQKADESTLAKRQIRALPKRALAASKSPSLNGLQPLPAPDMAHKVETASQPKFGGFVGFGATASNLFSFTSQPPPTFGSTSSPSDTAFKSTPSSVSPFSGTPKDPLPPKPPSDQDPDAVALKYFKSLRGLNVSFLSAISTAVEKDPFCDVANLVESYKNLRTTIQSEFDGSQPSAMHGLATTNNSTSLFGSKAIPEKTPSLFSVPTPSVGSVEASSQPPSTNEGGPKTGGFTFPPFVPPSSSAPTQLPFGLASKQSEPSTSSSATTPEPLKSAFAFAGPSSFTVPSNTLSKSVPGSSSQENEASTTSSSPRPSSTAPSLGSTGATSFFAATKSTSLFTPSDLTSKPTSVFGSSVFGNGSTTESSKLSPFDPSSTELDNRDSSKAAITLFGNVTAASSSSSTSVFQSSDKPVSFFGSASQAKAGAFVFGKPAGSIGNPVGFGFGSSSPSSGDTARQAPSGSGFSFGAPSTKPTESLFSPPMTDKSFESTPQPEAEGNGESGEEEAAKLLHSHTHDEEGEGEEDEETTHVVRCKVYRLFKSGEKGEWKDLGVGMFRLKKHKETNVRRVLMRNSNTGRILINFRIHESLKPSMTKNAISFVGYESNTPVSFSVRVKTEEQAKDLKQALEREIAAVQVAE